MAMITKQLPASHYGLRGNFSIPPHLRAVAGHYALQVDKADKGGQYVVRSTHGKQALDALLSSFMQEQDLVHQDDFIVLSKAALKQFLTFLHQPLRFSAETYVTAQEPDLKRRYKAKQIDEKRRAIHHVLRFVTKADPDISLYHEEKLEKEICECHADVENMMKEDDLWAMEIEIGNPENHGDHDHIVSAIPNSYYDPARGFVFKVHPDFTTGESALHGQNQQAFRKEILNHIGAVTAGRETEISDEIALSAEELTQLAENVYAADLKPLIENCSFEKRVQNAFDVIATESESLSSNMNFQRALAVKNETGMQDQKVQNLLRASTSLKPLIGSEALRRAWGHYKFTDRVTGMDKPMEGVISEMGVMQAVLQEYSARGDVSPAEMQAISNRYSHVLAFSQDVNEALCTALDKIIDDYIGDRGGLHSLKQSFNAAHDAYTAPALVGARCLNESYMEDEFTETLEIIRDALKQNGNALTKPVRGFGDMMVDWAGDLWKFATESPAAFSVYTGIMVYIIANAPEPQATQAIVDNMVTFSDGSNFEIPTEALEGLNNYVNDQFAQAGIDRSCHFDQIGFYQYKHCISEGLIAGNTKTLLNLTPGGPAFIAAGGAAATAIGNLFFNLNVLQNLSHGAFWGYTFKKGYQRGPVGFKKLAELSSPMVDPIAAMSMSAGRKIKNAKSRLFGGEVRSSMMQHVMGTSADVMGHTDAPASYSTVAGRSPLSDAQKRGLEKLTEASLHLVELEQQIEKQEIAPAAVTVKTGWQKKAAHIHDENYEPLVQALREFDVTLHYISSKIGISADWHKEDLEGRLNTALSALEAYAQDQDATKLQAALGDNMERLIGAQALHTKESGIFSALFNIKAEGDVKDMNTMRRFYSAWVGRENRADRRASLREANKKIRSHLDDFDGLGRMRKRADLAWNTLGRGGWTLVDGIVAAARTMHESYHITPYKKPILLTSAAIALAGAGYDALSLNETVNSDVLNMGMEKIAGVAGGGVGGSIASAFALAYNFVEDVLAIHVASGGAFVLTGAAMRMAVKKGVEPLSATFEEVTGLWSKIKRKVGLDKPQIDLDGCGFHEVCGEVHEEDRFKVVRDENGYICTPLKDDDHDHHNCGHHHD